MKSWLKKKLKKFLEIDEIKGDISILNTTVGSLYNEITELRSEIEGNIGTLNATVDSLYSEITVLRDEIEGD